MYLYEEQLRAQGYDTIAGVDEAGRSLWPDRWLQPPSFYPRAGLLYINDSKKAHRKKREELAVLIKKTALGWATGMATVEEILQQNIHQATLLAMRRAVLGLPGKPSHLLVDGFEITGLDLPQTPLKAGTGSAPPLLRHRFWPR